MSIWKDPHFETQNIPLTMEKAVARNNAVKNVSYFLNMALKKDSQVF